jgi:lysophospholipase L1-like esterase
MGWSGVGAVFRFDGTAASVSLDDAAGYFTVVVDGELQAPLVTSPGLQTYPLAAGLPAGEHTVELYRRTEGSFGPTVLHGVELTGELLPPPPVDRRIEVIGDSISCGYGNEGVDPCNFSAETENHYRTYGAFAARSLGAELSTVAWSGKGVIYNYGDDKNDPLPAIYDRTIAAEAAPWSFAWQPDAVVINLGTNDFSTDDDPPKEVFVPAYVDFLVHLREVYPEAYILIVAPSLWGQEATMVAGYLTEVVAQRQADGDSEVAFADINVDWIGAGCNGHPSVATHEAMGAKLAAELAAALAW